MTLSLGSPKMTKCEMNAFTNIDTLQVNFLEIVAIPLEKLQKYRLFEIYKWFMRYDDSKYPNFNAIKDKVSVFGVDCNYNHTVKVSEMNEIRELWIRISDSPVKTTVDEAWKAVHTLPNLRKLVVIFKSQYIDQVYENTCHLLGKIRVVYKCNNLDDNDVPKFRDFFNKVNVPVGLCDVHLAKFYDFLVDKDHVVIYPLIQGLFRVNDTLCNDPRFETLKQLYLPAKIDKV